MFKTLTILILCFSMLQAQAKTKTELWQAYDSQSTFIVDHSVWQGILDAYVIQDTDSGVNKVHYAGLRDEASATLKTYIRSLAILDPRSLNRNEQLAYWINLYNALTLDLVADNYPTRSIRKLGKGFFSFGPWDDELITINDQPLTLNDIEHQIIRPVFQDERIHYAVNCASIGCPNLSMRAYQGKQLKEQLDASARLFINNSRGVSLEGNKLKLSKIFSWYSEDFGVNLGSLINHLIQYADAELATRLSDLVTNDVDVDYAYDWSLNDVEADR